MDIRPMTSGGGTRHHEPLSTARRGCAPASERDAPAARGEHVPEDGEWRVSSVCASVCSCLCSQNLRHVLFSQEGKLRGLVTKTDIVWLLTAHLPHTGALANELQS